jgi:ligand-binding sensor domain-containing protein
MKLLTSLLALLVSLSMNAQSFTTYLEEDGLVSNSVNCVSTGEEGNVYFGTQFGISHFDGTNWTSYTEDDGLVDNNVTAILISDGVIWAGTDFGFSTFDGTTWATYTTDDGLEDNRIKDFFVDSDGLVWIGNNDGVSTFDGTDFINFTSADGLPFGGVSKTTQDQDGNMWLSNGIFGAIMYDGTQFTTFNEDNDLLSNSIRAIAVSASNKKWIATAEGISVLGDDNTHEEDHEIIFVLPPPDELNPVEDVAIDSQGHVWAGVYVDYLVTVGGISLYDSGVWLDYDEDDGVAGPNVRAISIDDNDGVWVATSTGVTYISDVPFSVYEQEKQTFKTYPNPSNGLMNIVLDNSSETLEIYSLTSELVYAETVKGKANHSLNLSFLSEGMYVMKYGNQTSRISIHK